MKQLAEFFKTILLGGLFVLLPLLLLYLLLEELLELVVALATPIAELFPEGTFEKVNTPVILGAILILGASFVFGLALRSLTLRRIGLWIEHAVLARIPFYTALKDLASGLLGAKDSGAFRPAVAKSAEGEREIVYVIEDQGEDYLTVLVPWAPASFAGSVKVMPRERIEMLDASLDETSAVLARWGVGVADLLKRAEKGEN